MMGILFVIYIYVYIYIYIYIYIIYTICHTTTAEYVIKFITLEYAAT